MAYADRSSSVYFAITRHHCDR